MKRLEMATIIQGNGLKRLANGTLVHFEMDGGGGVGGGGGGVGSGASGTNTTAVFANHQLANKVIILDKSAMQPIHIQPQQQQQLQLNNRTIMTTSGPTESFWINQQQVIPVNSLHLLQQQHFQHPHQHAQQLILVKGDSGAVTAAVAAPPPAPPAAPTQAPVNAPVDNRIVSENNGDGELQQQQAAEEPVVDIVINNVVCSFSVRCHLNLRQIALTGCNVEYRRENGMVTMKLRRPYTTASIWSSGKITCTGATTEDQSRVAARRYARALQKLGFNTRFTNFRVVNVLGTCSMPFAIKITSFSERYKEAEYEPELHPGVTFKMKKPKATLKIFSTGSITVTAPSVADIQKAIETIYPMVHEFRKERSREEEMAIKQKLYTAKKRKMMATNECSDEEEDEDDDDDDESETERSWK